MQPEEVITVNFKIIGQHQIEVISLPLDTTTETLKILLTEYCTIPIEEMRILHKGRAFKNGESLKSVGITDGATVCVVRGKKESVSQRQVSDPSISPIPNITPPAPIAPVQPPVRVESQQIKDLRKKSSTIQKGIAEMGLVVSELQTRLTQGNFQVIQESIQSLQNKFSSIIPQIQETASSLIITPLGSEEAPRTEQPIIEQPDPEPMSIPPPPTISPPPANNPPTLNPFESIIHNMFNIPPTTPQAPPPTSLFDESCATIINSDFEFINNTANIKTLDESYRNSNLYRQFE